MKKHKVIAMFSGGLDSCLAAHLMKDQGLEVLAFHHAMPFLSAKKGGGKNEKIARHMAEKLGMPIKVEAKGREFIEILRNPKFGHGSGINPCIDCRIQSLQRGRELMEEEGAIAVVTGEVMGQRPMSQKMNAMRTVERECGLAGKLLRPLSAKLLPETDAEKAGIINREKLLDISGRSRTIQLEMAEKIGLTGFSCGDGGCLLTDKNMEKKMRDLFAHKKDADLSDIRRLVGGRHFRLENGVKVVLGRNARENEALEQERSEGELLLVPETFPGPSALIQAVSDQAALEFVINVICAFSKTVEGDPPQIRCISGTGEEMLEVRPREVDYESFWIKER